MKIDPKDFVRARWPEARTARAKLMMSEGFCPGCKKPHPLTPMDVEQITIYGRRAVSAGRCDRFYTLVVLDDANQFYFISDEALDRWGVQYPTLKYS